MEIMKPEQAWAVVGVAPIDASLDKLRPATQTLQPTRKNF
jgi:hypothetical protein